MELAIFMLIFGIIFAIVGNLFWKKNKPLKCIAHGCIKPSMRDIALCKDHAIKDLRNHD